MKILLLIFTLTTFINLKSQTPSISFDLAVSNIVIGDIPEVCEVNFTFNGTLSSTETYSYYIEDIELGTARKGIDYEPISTQYIKFTMNSINTGTLKVKINPKTPNFESSYINLVIKEGNTKNIISKHNIILHARRENQVSNLRLFLGAAIDYKSKNLSISGLHLESSTSLPEWLGKFGFDGKLYYTNQFSDSNRLPATKLRNFPVYQSITRDTFKYAYQYQKAFGEIQTTNLGYSLSISYSLYNNGRLSIFAYNNFEHIIKNSSFHVDSIQSTILDTNTIVGPNAYFTPNDGYDVGTYKLEEDHELNYGVGLGFIATISSLETGFKGILGYSNFNKSIYINTSYYLLETSIGLRLASDVRYYLPSNINGIEYTFSPSIRLNLSQTIDILSIGNRFKKTN